MQIDQKIIATAVYKVPPQIHRFFARGRGMAVILGACLGALAVSAAAHRMDRSDLVHFETVVEGDTTHLRYVTTPQFGPLTYETALAELQTLCEMPQDIRGNVVVMIMDKEVPFGEPLGEIVTFAEIFVRDDAGCAPRAIPE